MLDVAIGTIEIFFILSLIGIGPALFLFKRPFEFCFAIAPAIGLTLTTLVETYLIRLDYPILSWAILWPLLAISLSFLLCFLSSSKKILSNNNYGDSNLKLLFVGLLITTLFVLAPMLIGGLTFTVLRGNGVDAFNYMTMAGYLQHEPFSWISTATDQALVNKHPSYILAKHLLATRWSTSVILGWGSTLTHIPLQRFEYGFTALFFMMTYCCAFSIASRSSLKFSYAVLLAIALSVGFWAQFMMDIRAMSHISALPVFLLLTVLLIHAEENSINYPQQIFMGMTLTAIALLYIELLPLIILGLFLFFVLQLIRKQDSLTHLIKKYWLAVSVGFLLLLPIAHVYLLQFLESQMSTAVHSKNNWDQMYFHWLYKRPLIGIWGLSYLEAIPSAITKIFFSTLAIILSIILLYGTIHSIIKWNKNNIGTKLCIAFLLATFFEFIYLYSQGQLWAAGKAISFGYPFLFFLIAIFGLTFYSEKRKYLTRACKYSVLVWLFIQCGLGFYRIGIAKTQTDYPRYTAYHNEYRKHDWDISQLTAVINQTKPYSVGLLLPNNVWLVEYLSFAWGWSTSIIDLTGIVDREGHLLIKQTMNRMPDYFVVPSDYPYLKKYKILARNKDIVLIERPKSTH